MRSTFGLIPLMLVAACQIPLELPAGASVACNGNGDCPRSFFCAGSGLCLPDSGPCVADGVELDDETHCLGDDGAGFCQGGICEAGRCGDGVVDLNSGEACDEGADNGGDDCRDDCTVPTCGDGIVDRRSLALGFRLETSSDSPKGLTTACGP